jgi:hypothetical protein
MNRNIMPSLRLSERRGSRIWPWIVTSSAAVGSSAMSRLGPSSCMSDSAVTPLPEPPFAGAAFAHQRQRLARCDRERDVVDDADPLAVLVARDGEALDLQHVDVAGVQHRE